MCFLINSYDKKHAVSDLECIIFVLSTFLDKIKLLLKHGKELFLKGLLQGKCYCQWFDEISYSHQLNMRSIILLLISFTILLSILIRNVLTNSYCDNCMMYLKGLKQNMDFLTKISTIC